MRTLAVLGVGTGVGKTHVGAQILRALDRVRNIQVAPFKPLESGVEANDGIPQDAARLLEASGVTVSLDAVCPWQLSRPVAPAEELERLGIDVSIDDITHAGDALRTAASSRFLLFEGAGGVLSPLTWKVTSADVASALDAGVWLVARDELGAISHVRTALESLERRELSVLGVILNRFPDETSIKEGINAAALKRLIKPSVWGANDAQVDASVVAESSVWLRRGS